MLKRLLSTTALGIIPFAAGAADLPVKAPVYKAPIAAPYSWTGFYAGANVGYSWGRSDVTYDTFTGLASGSERLHPNGVIGGFQIGYNLQTSRNWVVGLEADFQWSGQKKSVTRTTAFDLVDVFDPPDELVGTATGTLQSKLTWMGTARGKIGFVPDSHPELMLYATGGLAYGRVRTSFVGAASGTYTNQAISNCEGPSSSCVFSAALGFDDAKTKVGWTLGAGIESALGMGWTWKIEYLYVDLGTVSGTVPLNVIASCTNTNVCRVSGGTATYSNDMTDNIIRIGLNRRFGGP